MKSKIVRLMLCSLFIIFASAYTAHAEDSVSVYIDGNILSSSAPSYISNSTAYVPVKSFCEAISPSATLVWNAETKTATITSDNLKIEITDGAYYLLANERYFYLKYSATISNDQLFVPVRELAKAFDATVEWRQSPNAVYITSGSGYVKSGSAFYNTNDLYWLSRIINAESNCEPLHGKIAVGNVVMNRVKSPYFPNSIYGVIFDRKNGTQFQPVSNRTIYNTPSKESIIAAKICLEGYSLTGTCLFFQNPAIAQSTWITRNCVYVMSIGRHSFYA